MRRSIILLVPAFWISACTASKDSNAKSDAGTVAQAKVDHSADEATLRAIYESIPQQVSGGNAAAMAAMFADDGSEFQPGVPAAKGPDAVQKTMAGMMASMKNFKLTMGTTTVNVADAGDMAVVVAPYQLTFTDPKGKAVSDHGTSLTVFKKVNGQWKILYDTNASEVQQ